MPRGEKNGTGKLYDEEGELLYNGFFVDGVYDGEGKLYEEGELLYSGSFSDGEYDGEGKLTDVETGNLLYSGEFYQGVYSGTGKLYDSETQILLYDGEFLNGLYSGQGTLWDSDGNLLYVGNFVSGKYYGSGILYDTDTGKILQSGEFRNGELVTTSDDIDVEYGVITCTVTDTSGSAISGVEITLSDGQGGVTDSNGQVIFANHELGTWRVTATVPDGYTSSQPSVSATISADANTATVSFVLAATTSESAEE